MKISVREKINKALTVVSMILLVLTCSSCSVSDSKNMRDPEPEEGEIMIYCISLEHDSLHWENTVLKNTDMALQIFIVKILTD